MLTAAKVGGLEKVIFNVHNLVIDILDIYALIPESIQIFGQVQSKGKGKGSETTNRKLPTSLCVPPTSLPGVCWP